LDSKLLITLEFDKVLSRLAALTATAPGRERALALRPSADYDEVARRQSITAEALRLSTLKAQVSLDGVYDLRPTAHKAALGGILTAQELLEARSTLVAARKLRSTLLRLGRTEGPGGMGTKGLSLLAAIAGGMPDLGEVAAEIGRCISPRGEVTDEASKLLAALRRQAHQVHDRLAAELHAVLASPLGREVAQEPIITLREGRYVIPVKAEMRGHIPGIIHDVSHSGATVFLEPLAAVETGNAWRELLLEAQREEERVLRRLSERVGDKAEAIAACVEALA